MRSTLFPKNLTVHRERQLYEQMHVPSTSVGTQSGMEGFREEVTGKQGPKRQVGVDQEVKVIKGHSRWRAWQ